MDEEDLLDSKKELHFPKVFDSRFRVDYLWLFILCVGFMVMDQIMKYLDYCPELFSGGDYIFHVIQSLTSILSQLAVSVAAAIIFYYVVEFINAKKKLGDIVEIRKHLIFMMYGHMRILCHTPSFDGLNRNKKRLNDKFKMFLIMDMPIFLDSYYGCKKEKPSSELFEYFVRVENNPEDKEILMKHIQSFKREIDDLSVEKRFPFRRDFLFIRDICRILKSCNLYMKNFMDIHRYIRMKT